MIIADISGYTGYLTGAELDHARDAVAEARAKLADAAARSRSVREGYNVSADNAQSPPVP
ncbi:MAG TPA: hypothetical protein VGK88_09275 [bacterium]